MVSQIINVVVNSKGAVTVRKELNAIGDSAKQTANYLSGLRTILMSALAFSGVGQIVQAVDQFTVMQNRLRQVADSADMVGESWSRLLVIANNSYSTIGNTVDLYFRVAQAYRAWGESAEKAFEFTNLFQKAAVLSGSSMETTSQAVYQFSQALNKGKLDGDEFRSVLEGLPYVATIIQKSLGVTRKELYQLSKDGKISVERIKEAFESASKTIESDWKKITPTIGMAIIVLKNNWTEFVGSIQTSTGIFSGIASLIILVANNFGLLAAAISPLVASIVFLAGKAALGLVVTMFKDMMLAIRALIPMVVALNAAMYANPYVLAAVAIAAVVAAIVYFRNELGLTNEVLSTLWTTVVAAFTAFLTYIFPITALINLLVTSFTTWNDLFVSIGAAASATGTLIVNMFQGVGDAITSAVAFMGTAMQPLFQSLIELGTAFGELVKAIADLFIVALTPAVNALLTGFKTLWKYVGPTLEKFISLLTDIFTGWKNIANWLTKNFGPAVKVVFEGWVFILQTVVTWIKTIINALKTALALMSRVAGGGGGSGAAKTPGAYNGAQFYAGEFANGGRFNVGGTGAGRDNTPVSFRAQRGERVTVETAKQQRNNDNAPTAANVNVPVQIVNVLDPEMVNQVNQSAQGQRIIVNIIKDNRDEIRRLMGS